MKTIEQTKKRVRIKIEASVEIDADELIYGSNEVNDAIEQLRGSGEAEIVDISIVPEK